MESNKEIWKATEYPNYEVSNLGNVRYNNGVSIRNKKVRRDVYGYYITDLYIGGESKIKTVHRLIAGAFIPNPNNHPVINHINGIKTDNMLENLEWCTQGDNLAHAFRTRLIKREDIPHWGGKENRRSILIHQLTLEDMLIAIHYGTRETSRNTGISQSSISACINGKHKQAHGFKFIKVNATATT